MWSASKKYDVVVAGAGPSGIGAAVAASRCGAKVLMLEQSSRPGGVAVRCGCPGIMGCALAGEQVVSGVAEELIRRLARRGAAMFKKSFRKDFADAPITEEILSSEDDIALEATQMLREADVDMLAYCTVYGCEREERALRCLKAFCAGENLTLPAQAFVDCTGDALLAHLADLPTRLPAPEERMTKTVMLRVRNLEPFDVAEMRQRFRGICGTFPFPAQNAFMLHPSGMHGDFLLNITLTDGDPFDPADLTRMDVELREQVPIILDWLRNNIPEFRNCILEGTAPAIGVRNSRQLVGRETIRCEDLDAGTVVAKPVAIGMRSYGGHGLTGFRQDWAHSQSGLRGIPYGVLLSPECDNLAVGGRAISVEPRAVTAIRLMAQCFATGQAAGTIAAGTATSGHLPESSLARESLLRQNLRIDA